VLPICVYIYLLHQQDKRKTVEGARSTFMSAMSDAGLKPTVVYHNLSPAVLYEKVRAERHAGLCSHSNAYSKTAAQEKGLQLHGVRRAAFVLAGKTLKCLPDQFP
jgi:dolichyl-phosphate-mannose--protein O-mannosyl transferase